jgi:hypothetical protein
MHKNFKYLLALTLPLSVCLEYFYILICVLRFDYIWQDWLEQLLLKMSKEEMDKCFYTLCNPSWNKFLQYQQRNYSSTKVVVPLQVATKTTRLLVWVIKMISCSSPEWLHKTGKNLKPRRADQVKASRPTLSVALSHENPFPTTQQNNGDNVP